MLVIYSRAIMSGMMSSIMAGCRYGMYMVQEAAVNGTLSVSAQEQVYQSVSLNPAPAALRRLLYRVPNIT